MKLGEISVALSAEKTNLSKNLGLVAILGKAAVAVLYIVGCQDNAIGNFNKITVITTIWTCYLHAALGGKLFFDGFSGRGHSLYLSYKMRPLYGSVGNLSIRESILPWAG